MSGETKAAYRVATNEEKVGQCDPGYDLLLGPGGFECLLTEPEDRIWCRDGSAVVGELNAKHDQMQMLAEACKEFRESVLHDRHQLAEEGFSSEQTNAVLDLFDDTIGSVIDAGTTIK